MPVDILKPNQLDRISGERIDGDQMEWLRDIGFVEINCY
jgi:hypothetical protein